MKNKKEPSAPAVASPRTATESFYGMNPSAVCRGGLYRSLRQAVPIIDAAVYKLVRLTGGFTVECKSPASQRELDSFIARVPVGGNRVGLCAFTDTYFEQLLTEGTAVGEIITGGDGVPCALWNASLEGLSFERSKDGFGVDIYTETPSGRAPVREREKILFSVLNPAPASLTGRSLLEGLPFMSEVLLKIFEATGRNWERVGNVRFAVTYNPGRDDMDKVRAGERAALVAKEWSEAMQADSVRDFVAVGDVQIKAIGAECPIPDCQVPIRQVLEQIVAKTALPPYLLGLSWSSTERMASRQADALTAELWAYRRLLTPVIEKICRAFLRSLGLDDTLEAVWDDITTQDALEESEAALNNANAEKIRSEIPENTRGDKNE